MQTIEVKEKHKTQLLSYPNVVGVGVGYKIKNKEKTNITSIVVFVKKKIPEKDLKPHEIIPKQINGIPTDVVEQVIKPLSLLPPLQLSRVDKWRPAVGGISIGHELITAGTLGAIVYDNETGKKLGLSNNHILANSDSEETPRANEGDNILQPAPADGGTLPDDRIGGLLRWVKLKETGTNYVDCAVFEPDNQDDLKPEILDIGEVKEINPTPTLGMYVKKSGRTTGLSSGDIDYVASTIHVDYGAFVATFEDQFGVLMGGGGGDSGSLCVTEDDKALGLLFAGSTATTPPTIWYNRISYIVKELNINFGVVFKPQIISYTPIVQAMTVGIAGVILRTTYKSVKEIF